MTRTGGELHCHANSFRSIQYFKVKMSAIKNLSDIFKCLGSSLRELEFFGNAIDQLAPFHNFFGDFTSFKLFQNLKLLHLNKVSLVIEDFSKFFDLKTLEDFDISNNNLAHVNFPSSPGIFQVNTIFKARNCRFSNVSQIFNLLSRNIHTIDLSGNDLSDVNPSAFQSFGFLMTLRLEYANLTNFELMEFPLNLKVLCIVNNKLTQLIYSKLPKGLVEINVEGNELTEFRTDLPELNSLRIAHNRISCEHFIDLMKTRKIRKALLPKPYWIQKEEDCFAQIKSLMNQFSLD